MSTKTVGQFMKPDVLKLLQYPTMLNKFQYFQSLPFWKLLHRNCGTYSFIITDNVLVI